MKELIFSIYFKMQIKVHKKCHAPSEYNFSKHNDVKETELFSC